MRNYLVLPPITGRPAQRVHATDAGIGGQKLNERSTYATARTNNGNV